MTQLECTKCGMTTTHAQAAIENNKRTCGIDPETDSIGRSGRYPAGEKHNWVEEYD